MKIRRIKLKKKKLIKDFMNNQYRKQQLDLANKLEKIAKDLKEDYIGPEYAENLIIDAFKEVGWGDIRQTSK